jgi:hypothetical protein
VSLLVLSSAVSGWLFLIQFWILVWIFVFYFRHRQTRNPFPRRLDQLLALLVPQVTRSRMIGAGGQDTTRAPGRYRTLGRLIWSARRWRAQLGAVYAQGYQVASEKISSPGEVAQGRELVLQTMEALKAERASGGAHVPSREDPVVVLAYGLGAWPSGADLTSLEQLLSGLGVSQPDLRSRFHRLIRTVAMANQNREFRELAGASFVLGASARIIEAALTPGRSLSVPTIKAHLR